MTDEMQPKAGRIHLLWFIIPLVVFLLVGAFALGAIMTLERISEPFDDTDVVLEDDEEVDEEEDTTEPGEVVVTGPNRDSEKSSVSFSRPLCHLFQSSLHHNLTQQLRLSWYHK